MPPRYEAAWHLVDDGNHHFGNSGSGVVENRVVSDKVQRLTEVGLPAGVEEIVVVVWSVVQRVVRVAPDLVPGLKPVGVDRREVKDGVHLVVVGHYSHPDGLVVVSPQVHQLHHSVSLVVDGAACVHLGVLYQEHDVGVPAAQVVLRQHTATWCLMRGEGAC